MSIAWGFGEWVVSSDDVIQLGYQVYKGSKALYLD